MKRMALLLALVALASSVIFLNRQHASAAAGYRDVVMADNPIAYWRLGESAGGSTAVSETGQFPGSYVGSRPWVSQV